MKALRLSILDQSPIAAGSNATTAVAETVALARLGEALGYHRFWVAEHHASATFAGAAPEILIAALTMATRTIRLGSGGVLLPHYSPFKVAEAFSVLAALAPGRIDLGVGRASGSDAIASRALQRDRSSTSGRSDFPSQLAELLAYLGPDALLPAEHPFARLRGLMPHGGIPPELWLLGSSPDSARLAGEAGLPYVIADFINPNGAQLAARYRASFKPSASLQSPYVVAATAAICADDSATASDLRYPIVMVMALMFRGEIIPIPSVAEAKAWSARHPADGHPVMRITHGDRQQVRDGLTQVAADYGADELMFVNVLPDSSSRARSYALIADAFSLSSPLTPSPSPRSPQGELV
ncbi:LLM class flavin-dependent oxidoreductase [Sphingomonas sp. 2SG]|uniref:LLM class flavin-dependent oxidoreductase n=1 Tax=Sphingomonas sp. 2SG TaxID=2502201 RepID=UPI0010F687CD|nr:LLM class flavin-dependent oxidoreductase [Sphingomonas sp. 2SG]